MITSYYFELVYLTFTFLIIVVNASQLPENTAVSEIRGYWKREHSLVKPYQGSGIAIPNWDLVGMTMVTNQYVRLTPDVQSRIGALWNTVPIRSRDWETMITFHVHGSTGELYGDGLGLWYTKDRSQIGNVFGNKDNFIGLGILFDTYSNHNGPHNHGHPYISAMVNNGSMSYDHDKDGTHTQLAGCEAKFRNKDHDTSILIRYADDTVSVYTDIKGTGVWELCFSVPQVSLPTGYYLGASAATGDLSDNHDIVTIKTFELDVIRVEKQDAFDRQNVVPNAQVFEPPREHIPDDPQQRGWFSTIMWAIISLIVITCIVVVVFFILQKKQEQSRKRFY